MTSSVKRKEKERKKMAINRQKLANQLKKYVKRRRKNIVVVKKVRKEVSVSSCGCSGKGKQISVLNQSKDYCCSISLYSVDHIWISIAMFLSFRFLCFLSEAHHAWLNIIVLRGRRKRKFTRKDMKKRK